MAEADEGRLGAALLADDDRDGRTDADALAVVTGGENGRVGLAVGGEFARLAAVAVHAVEPEAVELRQESLPHDHERRVAQVREVGDEGDDALAGHLGDAAFGQSEETDVEVVEVELPDAPTAVGGRRVQALFVRFDEAQFLVGADAGEGVVRRVAENDEDPLVAFDVFGGVAFGLQFRDGELLLGPFGRFPAREGVGEIDADALGFVALRGERRAQVVEHEAELQVRDDERGGQDFKAEDALRGGLLHVRRDQGVAAFGLERLGDALQHFQQIRARAAARVQDDDVGVGEAVVEPQFLSQDRIDAGHLVLDDLRRGVPDAEFLPQVGVEGLQERLVEVLDGVLVLEPLEEFGAVHAVQGGGGPVQDLHEAETAEFAGRGYLFVQCTDEGHAQGPLGNAPVEGVRARRPVPVPEHPGGEDAVEDRLHERGAKEVFPVLAGELHAEGFFKGRPHGGQGRQVLVPLDAGAGVAGVGGEEPGHVLRVRERGDGQHGPLQVLDESLALFGGGLAGMGGGLPEVGFAAGEGEALLRQGVAVGVAPDHQEVAVVRDEDEAVLPGVAFDLLAAGHALDVVGGALDLDGAAGRELAFLGFGVLGALKLLAGVEAAVGMAGSDVGRVDDAANLGPESVAHLVEQVGKGRIAGRFGDARPGGV